MSRSIGLSIAAALSWLPLISIVVAQFIWIRLPATFTTHWNFAGIGDARAAPHTAFWDFAPPAAVLALTVTALVATVGGDISRRAGAIGIGLLAWLPTQKTRGRTSRFSSPPGHCSGRSSAEPSPSPDAGQSARACSWAAPFTSAEIVPTSAAIHIIDHSQQRLRDAS